MALTRVLTLRSVCLPGGGSLIPYHAIGALTLIQCTVPIAYVHVRIPAALLPKHSALLLSAPARA
jgi:hypothetical protein